VDSPTRTGDYRLFPGKVYPGLGRVVAVAVSPEAGFTAAPQVRGSGPGHESQSPSPRHDPLLAGVALHAPRADRRLPFGAGTSSAHFRPFWVIWPRFGSRRDSGLGIRCRCLIAGEMRYAARTRLDRVFRTPCRGWRGWTRVRRPRSDPFAESSQTGWPGARAVGFCSRPYRRPSRREGEPCPHRKLRFSWPSSGSQAFS
jgi:hypothetical protein